MSFKQWFHSSEIPNGLFLLFHCKFSGCNVTLWVPETRPMTVFFHSHELTKLSTLLQHGRVSQPLMSSCWLWPSVCLKQLND